MLFHAFQLQSRFGTNPLLPLLMGSTQRHANVFLASAVFYGDESYYTRLGVRYVHVASLDIDVTELPRRIDVAIEDGEQQVLLDSLNLVFDRLQNHEGVNWIQRLEAAGRVTICTPSILRSMAVGDVIVDVATSIPYLVEPLGFSRLPSQEEIQLVPPARPLQGDSND